MCMATKDNNLPLYLENMRMVNFSDLHKVAKRTTSSVNTLVLTRPNDPHIANIKITKTHSRPKCERYHPSQHESKQDFAVNQHRKHYNSGYEYDNRCNKRPFNSITNAVENNPPLLPCDKEQLMKLLKYGFPTGWALAEPPAAA